MDDQVVRAMQRWPDVPAAFGWLRLDRRGRWFLIDRNQPGFDESIHGQGSLISSASITEFISRNYGADSGGRWYWQNGPQKAFVDLQSAPLIVRVLTAPSGHAPGANALVAHTGYPVNSVMAAFVGLDQAIYLQTDLGAACIHDMDLGALQLDETSVQLLGKTHRLQYLDQPASSALGFIARPRR